jgi:hypothetical protein
MRLPAVLSRRLLAFALALPLAACGGGGATGPGGHTADPVGTTDPFCTIPATITVWNYSLRHVSLTHVFVDGDTSKFATFGPGDLAPGEWRTVSLSSIIGHTVAIDVHFADGAVSDVSQFTPTVFCGEPLTFTIG